MTFTVPRIVGAAWVLILTAGACYCAKTGNAWDALFLGFYAGVTAETLRETA